MTNLIGQSLGRYHILEQLGEAPQSLNSFCQSPISRERIGHEGFKNRYREGSV
jgi:hypothetical protein